MPLSDEKIKIAIFAGSAAERDYLRNCILDIPATVLCFEKETIIFDNFKSILPDVIIARTDSWEVAWRFIFAMHVVEADATLLIASDMLRIDQLKQSGLSAFIQCIPSKSNGAGIQEVVKGLLADSNHKKEGGHQPLLVGATKPIRQIRSMLPSLRASLDSILICGEQGTGKELLARLIVSDTQSSFVKLNCAELVPEMIARLRMTDEFFSSNQNSSIHEGPHITYPLVFLLDKINMLHPKAQSEILLLLEMVSKYEGSGLEIGRSNVRFVATSDKNLEHMVSSGRFRKDLFYRINVIPINLPPLRERLQDIPLLIDYFIIEACVKSNRSFIVPTNETLKNLYLYDWPGNLNELKKLMYRMVVAGDESCIVANDLIPDGKISKSDVIWQSLGSSILPDSIEIKEYLPGIKNYSLKSICDAFVSRTERRLMQKALESTNWNRKKAAKLLNISYKSMLNKIKAYDIV